MFKLNRMTDYGAVILSVLATQHRFSEGESLTAGDISEKSGLAQATTAKILKTLSQHHIVTSTRGKHGGYVLSKAPEDITVAAIVEAMEGPIAMTACVETSIDPCSSKNSCFLSGNWERLNDAISTALNQITLADLIDPDQYFQPQKSITTMPKH